MRLAHVAKLTTIGTHLDIRNNAKLASVSFPSLLSTGSILRIESNAELTALQFPSLRSVAAYLMISGNPNLASISFPRLVSTGGSLYIQGNDALTALQFGSIQKIGANAIANNGFLFIYNNSPRFTAERQPITSPACKALKDACRNTPQCSGDYRSSSVQSTVYGPDLKTCN